MNKWKIAFFVATLVAITSNMYWFMQVVDGANSYSYLNDSYEEETRRFKALGKLMVKGSADYSQADLLHLLRRAHTDAFIVEEQDKVFFEGIEFMFVGNELVEIK